MSLELFLDSIKSPETKDRYNRYLKFYGLDKLKSKDPQTDIINFIIKCKKEGKSYAAIHNYVSAVKSYYQINDVVLNVKKIGRFMPEQKRVKKDRGYFDYEIAKMLQVADLRTRVIILVLASSGCRLGAIPFIKLKNLEDNKLTIYENDREEYFTFITPECKKAIDDYLDMRSRYGDILKPDEPLIREDFNLRKVIGPAKFPTHITLRYHLDIIAKKAGVRTSEVRVGHGFRKFFTTQLINSKVNSEIREMLLGHKIGLAGAYYRPTEQDMYSEYEKALDLLTINEENRLRRKVQTLTIEKSIIDDLKERVAELEKVT